MTNKIVNLNEIKMRQHGETMFLGCPCGEDGGFAVLVLSSGDQPVISGLVCLACEAHVHVAHGRLD